MGIIIKNNSGCVIDNYSYYALNSRSEKKMVKDSMEKGEFIVCKCNQNIEMIITNGTFALKTRYASDITLHKIDCPKSRASQEYDRKYNKGYNIDAKTGITTINPAFSLSPSKGVKVYNETPEPDFSHL